MDMARDTAEFPAAAEAAGLCYGDDREPGYRRIRLRPLPSPALKWCRASYRSHLGQIASEWTCDAAGAEWTVSVPPNCTATVELPARFTAVRLDGKPLAEAGIAEARSADGGIAFAIGSGEYAFALSA